MSDDNLPIGKALPNWRPRLAPSPIVLSGHFCRLEPLHSHHANALFAVFNQAKDGRDWLYLSAGPFTDAAAYRDYVQSIAGKNDPLHFAVIDLSSHQPLGTLALMRQAPEHGVVEVGFVTFSPALQRSPLASEAQFLLMRYVFDELAYRRYEWKCDSLNQRSINAAERLGFIYEGCFRQAMVYKGRNRDTAWFAIIDADWPLIKAAFTEWLNPQNFDQNAQQIQRLQAIRERLLKDGSLP